MVKYCSECGEKIDDDATFCQNCGAKSGDLNKTENNNKPLILGLTGVVLILVLGIVFVSGGFGLFGENTSILFISESPITNSGNFTVELTSGSQGISGKDIEITFKNNKNSYTFNGVTDNNGFVNVLANVEEGDYEVTASFAGDSDYKSSSAATNYKVETKATEIDSQVTSSRTEPDYQSFWYSHSFEDTDKNGDGYVYLSDMNIAHTPKNIVKQMFSDSDDDHDGRLNHNEYYKFMYKLNYDTSSYGL